MKAFWLLAFLAVFLGIATTATILIIRWPQIAPEPLPEGVTKPGIAVKSKAWDVWSSEIDALSEDLKKEREDLAQRAKDLDALAERLAAEKQELLSVRAEIEAMRDEIARNVPVLQASEKVNVKALSRSYAAMDPKQAVAILAELEEESTVKLLAVMKPDVVGAIFEEMARSPALAPKAAKLTDQLRLLKKEQSDIPPAP